MIVELPIFVEGKSKKLKSQIRYQEQNYKQFKYIGIFFLIVEYLDFNPVQLNISNFNVGSTRCRGIEGLRPDTEWIKNIED